ncbi:MAG TPA: sugar-transfer associated ATP-grasp domain-containing protein [Eudoraea sp.]|nr:sugar-transfer associated ATP-grasp domain-containing protein [Eudoraea sp.]
MSRKDTLYRISVVLKDKDKKSYFKILKEVITLWVIKKRFPQHYFGRFLYRKNSGPYKNYLDNKEYNTIISSKKLNLPGYYHIVDNKLTFAMICEKFNLPAPKLLGYNLKRDFFYQDKVQRITGISELGEYFEKLFSETGEEKVFVKSLNGSGGKETYLLKRSTLNENLKELGDTILDQPCIHQACIEQHPEISKIYAGSVNSMRVETYMDKDNNPEFLGILMRFGVGGSPLDNVSAGGFFVAIDKESGTLMETGMKALIFGGTKIWKHPDTGFRFEGFKVPYFEECKALCVELLRYFPCRLAGWDIAITPTGPVVIEGNPNPGINMGELEYGGLVNHPMYREVILGKS